jgi:4-amino-4-deoxy-L-arabinose transferase-like glycosyltransferase
VMLPREERRVIPVAWHLFFACLAGLALRLLLIKYYASDAGDSPIYEQLAWNWLDHHVYGLWINGQLTPVNIRLPGYPAFLAVISLLFGRGRLPILLSQAVVDLGTCVLTAALAALLAPVRLRRKAAIAAAWLACLCPFLANYCAVPLSEVLAAFFCTAATLYFVRGLAGDAASQSAWLVGGVLAGLGTLVRPETPLLAAAAGFVALLRWRRPRDWTRLARAAAMLAAGVLLPLLPWAARNWKTLNEKRLLAPRYAEMPFEYVPRGYYAWTGTWLVRFRDINTAIWNLEDEPLSVNDFPAYAFDNANERARVSALLDAYNDDGEDILPATDQGFAELARERTRDHPFRTYAWVPFQRALTLWFTPRLELLPYSGMLWPPGEAWREDPVDFSFTIVLGALNFIFVGLAAVGFWIAWRHRGSGNAAGWGLAFLAVYLLARTAFLTTVEAPEPRYVLVAFPIVFALAAQCFLRSRAGE